MTQLCVQVMVFVALLWPLGHGAALLTSEASRSAQGGETYEEDFTTYHYKDHADNVIWDVASRDLKLALVDSTFQANPAIAASNNEHFIVVWFDRSNGGMICAQKLDSAGNRLWEADTCIDPEMTVSSFEPGVAVDDDGNSIVTWAAGQDGEYNVYAQKVDSNGKSLWSDDLRINSDGGASGPKVATAVGSVYVAWSGGLDEDSDVFLGKLDDAGHKVWLNDVRVNSDETTSTQASPDLTADGEGNVTVVWNDNRNTESDHEYEVFAQRVDTNGNTIWAYDVNVTGPRGFVSSGPKLADDGAGGAFVAWLDKGTGV